MHQVARGLRATVCGNHARGTPIVRPSDNSTHMLLSSKRTDLAEIFIPGPFDQFRIVGHDIQELFKRSGIETIALGQRNIRKYPKLGFAACTHDMDMRRFAWAALVRKEEETKSFLA
jgi:hypothetical protein